ncbi:MAG: hypothetical protein AB7P52_13755 [Alphaproteobacteria bacterium]
MTKARQPLTREQVVAIVGEFSDARIAAILNTGATVEELEEAAALAAGESDVVGREGYKPSRVVATLYDIISPAMEEEPERDRG